ncbi:MAG: 4-hydroxy-tetrahydrodipicolinate reductase [Ruminococcaceae bacterium]|nr:4-hydroxy-tetrahydrodipicolinate reductase [Oscillospiraceae bacterium]
MTNIILTGALGRMGRFITAKVAELDDFNITAAVDITTDAGYPYPLYSSLKCIPSPDGIIIDFSNHALTNELLDFAVTNNLPCVISTTGHTEEEKQNIYAASEKIPVFYSYNMSIGINLITELSKKAAALLGTNFDIEIVEKHHNKKLDAPSGTALMIADGISEVMDEKPEYVFDRFSVRKERSKNEIGFSSVRGGTIVGEHDVIFAGYNEVITLSHHAASREVFAMGAIRAAEFLAGKPAGMYNMKNLIGNI